MEYKFTYVNNQKDYVLLCDIKFLAVYKFLTVSIGFLYKALFPRGAAWGRH